MLNGVIVIDKPEGKTSHDIVAAVKKICGVKKAGHIGTLDPLATGVLPVCLNEATKLAGFLTGEEKEYRAAMILGVRTDTMDTQGKIIGQSCNYVPEEEIRKAFASMVGTIEQVPPSFSAAKFQGKPLYQWARNNIFPKKQPREVKIYQLTIEKICFPEVVFRVLCSKGTYIRTLCSDIGDKLGTGACLSSLRRLRSGFFKVEKAVSLSGTDFRNKKMNFVKGLPMTDLLPCWTTIEVRANTAQMLLNGWQPSAEVLKQYELPLLKDGDMVKFVSNGCLLAVAKMLAPANKILEFDGKMQIAKILRVFHNH